jgi:hypothetical protein
MKNTDKTLNTFIRLAKNLVKKNKTFNTDVQNFLESFVSKYNKELSKNSTPLHFLLNGLKNNDVSAIKSWFKTVTNAEVTTNTMGHYTLKFAKENKDRNLVYVENYDVESETRFQWFMSVEKQPKEPSETYKDTKTALKNVENTLDKAIKTCKTQADKEELLNLVKSLFGLE